jgi:hypothetical protein
MFSLFIIPQNVSEPDFFLPFVKEKITLLSHVAHIVVAFYLIEPLLLSLGEGNLLQEGT